MSKVTLDAATLAKLAGPAGVVEVCDESGRVVGVYAPQLPAGPPAPGWGSFTAEQVERAKQRVASGQSGPYRTLAEIEREHGHLWRTS